MHIMVTVPKGEKANIAKEDLWAKKQKETVLQYWKVSRPPKRLEAGDRVYFVEDGHIRYYHNFLGIVQDFKCEVTGRFWPGTNLKMTYPETILERQVPMKGFRGFRYTEGHR